VRRHLDVHDGDVGPVGEGLAQEVVSVARLTGDLEAGVGQQASDPFPH
jgi:hypothetical protein